MKLFKAKTPEEKRVLRRERLLVLVSGLLTAAAFPPVSLHWLLFVGLVPLFLILDKRTSLRSLNGAGYLFGFIFSFLTVYWVGAFTEMKDPFLMIAGGALLFFNPLLFVIPATLFYCADKVINRKTALFLLPFFWLISEYIYSITDVSFPWLTLGQGIATFTSYIQIADHIGSMGLTVIIAYVNLFIYLAYKHFAMNRKLAYRYGSVAVLMILLPVIYGNIVLSNADTSGEKLRVGIIQPDLDPYEKWSYGDLTKLARLHLELSDKAISQNANLIIWPETALPVYLLEGGSEVRDTIMQYTLKNNVSLLTGMPHKIVYPSKEYAPYDAKIHKIYEYYYSTYNAILLFTPQSYHVQNYNKMKLVPFGEKTPYADKIPLLGELIKWSVGIGAWNVGTDTTLLVMTKSGHSFKDVVYDTVRIGGLVCYESIYPDLVAVLNELGADLFVVVTNDSWYGNTSGPYQHKEFAALRAVETRKSVVRCANGGISCVIDPYGRTTVETKMYTRDVLVADVQIRRDEPTFYSRNPLIAAKIASAISVLIFGMFWVLKLKKRFPGQDDILKE
ncbi:MAG: apolipoprotein N-acyltransferase [Ignavibacteriaceae bacterium]|nr:apolipoprotein N-acyltransferase [Ignavibacteriaceae bacterium]